jgi:FMN phosphatase YigB (HAD superfamily)
MVGDFHYDIEAGRAAGARTVWLHHGEPAVAWRPAADHAVTDLAELAALLGVAAE